MKTLLKASIFLLILSVAIYFSANFILRKVTLKVIADLKLRLEQQGIIIDRFDYSTVRLNSHNSCSITNIDLDLKLNRKMYGKESFSAAFDASSIAIRFADFNNPSLFFTLNNFSLFVEPEDNVAKKPFGKLDNGYLKSRIPIYLQNPEESVAEIFSEIKTLFHENTTQIDIEFRTDAYLGIDDKEVKVGLFTEQINGLTYLKFNANDIIKASAEFELDLAEKEAEIIANYPSKVPSMIKITRDAKRLSEMEQAQDRHFPQDAYRHIYWSYQLTREFGPELAKKITDAHETAPGNTQKERKMDYHNNEVGRMYAEEFISLNELKQRVLNADEIVRDPNEMN